MATTSETSFGKAGWRVREWADATGTSRSFTCQLLKDQKLDSVKAGKCRIIVTSPQAYLASLADEAAS